MSIYSTYILYISIASTYYSYYIYNGVGCSPTSYVHCMLTLLESLQMSMHAHTEDKLRKRLS